MYSEGDLLPALIVDRYGDYLSLQTLNQGMDRIQADIVRCLENLLLPKGIIARNDVAVRTREELPIETKIVSGEVPARVDVDDERTPLACRPGAWAEDRSLSRSTRKLS